MRAEVLCHAKSFKHLEEFLVPRAGFEHTIIGDVTLELPFF
jgi:hypothetical protein